MVVTALVLVPMEGGEGVATCNQWSHEVSQVEDLPRDGQIHPI